jgi:hypothetical protein
MLKRFASVLAAFAALAAILAVCVSPAGAAVSATPLGIKSFTMQTIEGVEERPVVVNGKLGTEFVDKPYTFTQAGGHPWGLLTTAELTTEEGSEGPQPTHDPKDIVASLPPGLLGDPQALPRCSLSLLTTGGGARCPASTVVGTFVLYEASERELAGSLVNVKPEAGQSAEFALDLDGSGNTETAVLTAHLVRTAQGSYAFTVTSNGIPPQITLYRFELTFWGVPADPSHDAMRDELCRKLNVSDPLTCGATPEEVGGRSAGVPLVPFLTWPSDCSGGPLRATLRADSWEEPGSVREGHFEGYAEATAMLPAVTGCDRLGFEPGTGIEVQPDTRLADEPVGLGVNLHVPLNESPTSTASPLLRDTRVTFPAGMSVSPGVVDGVRACEATGPEGINIEGVESEEVGLNGELQLAPGKCPDASIVGEAEAITPFLPVPVKGHVYLARPGCGGSRPGEGPCTEQDALDGNLYKLYLEIGGEGVLEGEGIVFKVPFQTEANPATGQLTTDVRELVQAPYSEVRIRLNGGPRAPIDNPATCGPAATSADFTPWSAPGITPEGLQVAGTTDLLSSSSFDVEGCAAGAPPLKPGFQAGTVSPRAGEFSTFTMNLSREDREQYVKGVQIHTPPGLLAMLSSVPLCPEAQANDPARYGECTASKIGTTRVASGAGSHPFEIEGDVYLTGPHDGAPFGLSIVTHAVAGPFNLGLVVVRARIDIDPGDSTALITTDETGPYALPQIIFGVPLRLKAITVNIDRPGFMFNPTNCQAQQVTGVIAGNQNATAPVSSPFAAAGCKSLAFKPRFTASTSAHTSRLNGARLDVKLTYPPLVPGSEANIASVKVELPKQLPSRLSTLQKACAAAQFALDPSGCPAASIVGIARASTPVLPVGLSGPVYFVSHGGEAFPSLIVVLQGDGVRVDLTGSTFISKAGITSSTFKTVPDVPVGSFELYLPQGKFSALAANGNLCASKLALPTEFVAQNGAVIHQSTKLAVTGCPAKKTKKTKTRRAKKAGQGKPGPGRVGSGVGVAGDVHVNGRTGR